MLNIFRENINRHEKKAASWVKEGRLDYAEGSMKKAARWRLKEHKMSIELYGHLPPTRLQALLHEKVSLMEETVTQDLASLLFPYGRTEAYERINSMCSIHALGSGKISRSPTPFWKTKTY